MEQIKTCIATGKLKAGDKLPSVRELAVEAGVNPNTMQKALSELERDGLLYSTRAAGRYVSESSKVTSGVHDELVEQYMKTFTDNMAKVGYLPSEAAKLYQSYVENQ